MAVLGASNHTYAEGTLTQSLPDWLGSHVRAFEYFGGTTTIVVPDNLRSGVTRACRYDPDLNPSYQQWAEHYCVAVVPARPYKPKDKACDSYCLLCGRLSVNKKGLLGTPTAASLYQEHAAQRRIKTAFCIAV